MFAQVTIGAQIEREMGKETLTGPQRTCRDPAEREKGTVPFLIVYLAGGIYGFVLGGNFSRPAIPSVGASGSLFAIVRPAMVTTHNIDQV
jgi:membrane associated rhomboid family serine protease